MRRCLLITQLFLVFLTSVVLSGCISQRLAQRKSLIGELFLAESNRNMPPDIQILEDLEYKRYLDMNYIDNVNFVILRRECCMPEEQFNKLLLLRWSLLRLHRQNEILLEEAKTLYKKVCKRPARKLVQKLNAKYDEIRQSHAKFMRDSAYLLEETAPYKPWLIRRLIILPSTFLKTGCCD